VGPADDMIFKELGIGYFDIVGRDTSHSTRTYLGRWGTGERDRSDSTIHLPVDFL